MIMRTPWSSTTSSNFSGSSAAFGGGILNAQSTGNGNLAFGGEQEAAVMAEALTKGEGPGGQRDQQDARLQVKRTGRGNREGRVLT